MSLVIGDGGAPVVEPNFPVTDRLVGTPSRSGLKLAWTVNVSAAQLSDGSYVVVVSEIVPFTIYKSSSLDGPWTGCQPTSGIGASNISFVERHDGKFEIVERNGTIAISNTLCGNYVKQTPTCTYTQNNSDAQGNPVVGSIYAKRTSIPGVSNPTFIWQEDPHIWISGGTYHIIY